jgi:catechol 2,3-dioxygenase-like lactoylglutathione lyase family enzyme
MKRRHFMGTVAGVGVAAGMQGSAHGESAANPDAPIMELRVALTTQAFEKLSAFYRAGLGLEPSHEWPQDQGRSLVLDLGRATLEVFDEKQAQTIDQFEVGRRVSGPVRFALQVSDLNAAVKRLEAHGATLVHGPITAPWGDQTARFADPDGMQITLYQKK